jgi:methionyl-tRNA synthetase
MLQALGLDPDSEMMQTLTQGGGWGLLKPGSKLNTVASLFPRIDTKKQKEADSAKDKAPSTGNDMEKKAADGLISFDHFKKVDLRVARVIGAEPVPKSEKLLKLQVLAPEKRTIVSGIAGSYKPGELVGKNVVIVANLKPVKLMGIVSEGMVLTAETEEGQGTRKLTLVSAAGVEPGCSIA